MMKCFDHVNIIKLISYGSDQIVFRSGKTRNVHYIVLEYAQMGDLFDLVKNAGFFSESTARFFFKQIVEGVDHINMKGKCHRDLKLENILIGNDFVTKIADFGFCSDLTGPDIDTICGTPNFMAPELLAMKKYDGKTTDVFALGVILFIMVTGKFPFEQADSDNERYRLIATGKSNEFWNYTQQKLSDK